MGQPFTLYIIQSAHTDIGYTHPQEQIKLMYLEAYDRVLELCRASATAPEPQRFKWTCETAWQARHYLAARPEREEEFLQYVRAGQIELTACYLHFTDLIDEDAYRRSLSWASEYSRRHGLPLRCAMHCDINGWPWAVADLLAEANIPFFCSQVHVDSATDPLGRRGSIHYQWLLEGEQQFLPQTPVRTPQAFWWQGPRGGRVLHWLNEHYLLGNVLGISSPRGFHADKTRYFTESDRAPAEELYERASRELPAYLERLRRDGYAYNILLLSTGGYYVDNSPPDTRWLEVIARWNAEHDSIKLRTATLGEWFEALQALDDGSWPTHQVAWPDHWAHGLGSATMRIAQARRMQRRRADAEALILQAREPQAASFLEQALEQERLALEHTFDAWSTTARPHAPANHFQQIAKELTFYQAELYLDEALGRALRALLPPDPQGQQLVVAGAQPGAGPRLLHFSAGDQPLDPQSQVLSRPDGATLPFQLESSELRQYIAALPERPAALLPLRLAARRAPGAGAQTSPAEEQRSALESPAWLLQLDPATGTLLSLRERASGREWVDAGRQEGFGQLIHERVVHPLGRPAAGNLARFVALDIASESARQRLGQDPVFTHTTPAMDELPRYVAGPVFDALELTGGGEQLGRLRVAWRLYHALPLVELVIDWDKPWNERPEAAYVAFPFAVTQGQLALETGGGFFRPGQHEPGGQLPGTCSSYYTIQRAAHITDSEEQGLLWLPLDTPLVMTNAIDYNRWESEPWRWNGLLASMPVNHYWHTNFPTSQRGHLRLRYRISSLPAGADRELAIKAATPLEALGWR